MDPERRARWAVALGAAAAAAALWEPAFRAPVATGIADWPYFLHMWEAGRVAVTRFGEWPLWDPFHCGGVSLFRNPQSQVYGPLFPLALLVGSTLALKLFGALHAAAGFAGAWLFARREAGLSPLGAVLASVAWAGSGFFAWHGAVGHVAFLPFWLTPWLLLAWRAAARDPRFAVWLAAGMTLLLFEGAMVPFAYASLLLGFDAACRLRRETWRPILVAGVASAGLTALLGALRLLPIAARLGQAPRHTQDPDALGLGELLEMWTARSHGWVFEGHRHLWHEYALYVGWAVLGLAVWGAAVSLARRRPAPLLGLLLFAGLALGDHGPASPWGLLHQVPPFASLRVPSRFGVYAVFFLAWLAGTGLDALCEALRRRVGEGSPLPRVLALVLAAACCIDLLLAARAPLSHWPRAPLAEERPAARFHLSEAQPYLRHYASYPRLGIGSRECYEAMHHDVAEGLWIGDVAQVRVASGRGRVLDEGRTTSRAWARVALETPGSVVFDQNFAPGWQATAGHVEADAGGRLVVRGLSAGEQRIEIVYRPPTLAWALALSGLGLAFSVLWWRVAARFAPHATPAARMRTT